MLPIIGYAADDDAPLRACVVASAGTSAPFTLSS